MPSWLQQVSPHSICVGEFECFASEDEELNQTQVDPPSPHESIPSQDSFQPILPPLFFFFFHSFLLVFPLCCPWANPVVLSQLLAECAEGGSRVALGWYYHNWCLPAQGSALGVLGQAKEAPFPPHSGLSCRAFLAVPPKTASPSSAPFSDSM